MMKVEIKAGKKKEDAKTLIEQIAALEKRIEVLEKKSK